MNGELMQLAKDWIWIGWIMGPVFLGAGLLWLKERFPTKQEHADQAAALKASVDLLTVQVERRQHEAELRLNRLEAVSQHQPSRQDLEEINRRLGKVEQTTAVTNEAVAGLGRLLGKVDHTATLLLNRELNEAGK